MKLSWWCYSKQHLCGKQKLMFVREKAEFSVRSGDRQKLLSSCSSHAGYSWTDSELEFGLGDND